jgi:hypothetical protein
MEGQREKLNGNRRRRRRNKTEPKAQSAPVLIAARRPDSPRLGKISRRNIAASARPKRSGSKLFAESPEAVFFSNEEPGPELGSGVNATEGALGDAAATAEGSMNSRADTDKPRRVVRIALAPTAPSAADEVEGRRARLLDRLVTCEGRGAISRIASELIDTGGIPEEQPYQIQLLEHVDERRASDALDALNRLLERQVPIKRPILDQRLRRLEEEAEEASVRDRARELRRRLRASPASNERI